jgi:hypothetical protein
LAALAEPLGLSVEHPEPGRVTLRWAGPPPAARGVPAAAGGGLEVTVRPAAAVGALSVTAGVYGSPGESLRREAERVAEDLLARIRRELGSGRERRVHRRFRTGFRVRAHPVDPGGVVGAGADGLCEDVSVGGIRFLTWSPVPVGPVYLEFCGVGGVAGQAVLAAVLRSVPADGGHVSAGQFPDEGEPTTHSSTYALTPRPDVPADGPAPPTRISPR